MASAMVNVAGVFDGFAVAVGAGVVLLGVPEVAAQVGEDADGVDAVGAGFPAAGVAAEALNDFVEGPGGLGAGVGDTGEDLLDGADRAVVGLDGIRGSVRQAASLARRRECWAASRAASTSGGIGRESAGADGSSCWSVVTSSPSGGLAAQAAGST